MEAILSPTVLRKDGYRLYFLARRAKFWLEPKVELAYNYNLSRKQLGAIEAIMDEHYREIVDAWRDHFGN